MPGVQVVFGLLQSTDDGIHPRRSKVNAMNAYLFNGCIEAGWPEVRVSAR